MSDLISRAMAKAEIMDWARVITNPKMLSTEDTMHILDSMEGATDEEFKTEAERRGYRLQTKSEIVKFLPCVCGSKRRIRWFRYVDPTGYTYQCEKCGLKSELGKTQKLAKANWNAMIEEKMKEGSRVYTYPER